MAKILVAYVTNAGSTTQVAETIAGELGQEGASVDVKQIKDVASLDGYDAVVVGGPMILGWHRDAVNFVVQHQAALSGVPVAYFFTSLNLTQVDEDNVAGVPIYLDPASAKPPKRADKLNMRERFGLPAHYLEPVLEKAPQVKPVSAGYFGGKLDYSKINLFGKLFVAVIVRAKAGDFRNQDAMREWAAKLRPALTTGA
jgi:menaquinone-dependent protoporphyrinogen oxidase